MTSAIITVRIRLRDKHKADLNRQARSVNLVWNYCNETQEKTVRAHRKWLSGFDLMKLTAGASADLGVHSCTIQKVCAAYDRARTTHKRPWLRWRSRRSLGWVPFSTGKVRFDGTAFVFNGKRYEAMHLRSLLQPGQRFGTGSFNADSSGNWYCNVPIEVECADTSEAEAVGVDLGLKTLATMSDGSVVEMPRFYRQSEAALAVGQRGRKTKQARAISLKVANRRKDFQHKASKALCEKYGIIIVGDVNPSKLAKTKMAKSIHDASWSIFKNMIRYKAITHGTVFLEVSEAYSTQTCSSCGSLPASRPKGIAGLGMREWECSDCGTVHDRDVNAARNILRVGLDTLDAGVAEKRPRGPASRKAAKASGDGSVTPSNMEITNG